MNIIETDIQEIDTPDNNTSKVAGSGTLDAQNEPLTPGQDKRLSQWGERYKNLLARAWKGLVSPRTAIKLQCLECCGEDVKAVRTCPSRQCPLWQYRPFQGGSVP